MLQVGGISNNEVSWTADQMSLTTLHSTWHSVISVLRDAFAIILGKKCMYAAEEKVKK